ncbi:hypothetical protein DL764_008188 [Monosporascus ibericus]|uniref:Ribosomal RNA-processing protein 17 n=1 Tax=Monosporascus ibericus TaxID=155417 RepID=A0A4Q4T0D1_9PEZI|nr:hypothetical protein DL764_008188 [Monosporascus ibericus]
MFARPRPKKSILGPPPKKRKAGHAVEEIKFDAGARDEYLTGFHKRKLQRAKRAQEEAAKKARQEKIDLRKHLREERKKDIEEHVQHVASILKQVERAGYIDEEELMSGEEGGEWGGFEDAPAAEALDHEEEYIDEDRFTTVTVESVNVSRDGLVKPAEEESDEEDEEGVKGTAKQGDESTSGGTDRTLKPRKKKQKFRYETKVERQQNQRREKARKRRKAAA